ncbi:DUF58 domain-containing protein [Natronoglomus mannanivorans]|uniref:DUF58 domain-containing protein n=1 Tax=Natronoglomus mannanivorans TaxID=2979990 RepID=A0AAP2YYG3_9EURY|nr:DUF58 domain-containing protein [Halobacteria archaeon AArc-xg1-1]
MTFHRVPRWRTALGTTLALAGIALWLTTPELLVAAMVPVAYVAYSAATSAVPVDDVLTVERTVDRERPFPGERVSVTLTLTNTGSTPLPDVRVVDGVPEDLPVADDSPRASTAIRAGGSATVEYAVTARRGDHEFGSVRVRTRSMSASSCYTTDLTASGIDELTSTIPVDEWPLGERTIRLTGQVPTDSGGDGLEFHTTRSYQPGDPIGRINWRRYAKEGELTTIDYRENEASKTVVLVDARSGNHVARAADEPTATELSVYAAARALGGLLSTRQHVGLAAIGIDDPTTGIDPAWVPPGTGAETRSRALSVLDRIAAAAAPGSDVTSRANAGDDCRRLEASIDSNAQLLVVSPVLDRYPQRLVERFRARGHDVTVFAPNVTDGETPGQTIAALERTGAIRELRETGATVVDWDVAVPIELALNRAFDPALATA